MENISERLVSVRKIAGISLQELADSMEIKITRQALHKYEQGKVKPSSRILIGIAKTNA